MTIEWDYDTDDAPRDGCEQLVVAVKGTKRVKVTWWAWQDYTQREGGWVNLLPGEEIVAWSRANYPTKDVAPVVSLPKWIVEAPVVSLPFPMLPPGVV